MSIHAVTPVRRAPTVVRPSPADLVLAVALALLTLVLSMHDESLYAERVLRAGGQGYLMKHEGGEKIMSAVRQVLSGRIYLSEKMSDRLIGQAAGKNASPAASMVRSTGVPSAARRRYFMSQICCEMGATETMGTAFSTAADGEGREF